MGGRKDDDRIPRAGHAHFKERGVEDVGLTLKDVVIRYKLEGPLVVAYSQVWPSLERIEFHLVDAGGEYGHPR